MKNRSLFSFRQPDLYVLLLAVIVVSLIFTITSITSRNIRALQESNAGTSTSYQLKDKVQILLSDVLIMENAHRGVILADEPYDERKDSSISLVQSDLLRLGAVVPADFTKEYEQLAFFVNRKIKFSKLVLNTYVRRSKQQSEALIGTGIGEGLTDSVTKYATQLESKFAAGVQSNLDSTNRQSETLKPVISTLALISLIAILASSLLIIYRIRQKNRLINNLEEGYEREMVAVKELEVARRAAERSLQVKESFLANMSHEIRTPITGVIGFSNILHKSGLRPDQEKLLGYIQSSGTSLLSIVNDILDLSKLEAGMVRIEKVPFRLRELAEEVAGILLPSAKEKCIDLRVDVDVECEEYLLGDPVRLKQVLTNLVANAVKFTENGFITLSVSVVDPLEPTHLIFTVKDTGIGMSSEQLERVFQRFEQGESDTARKYGGTGLGLAISKNLVELQGGTIGVESQPGEGTSFKVTLPFERAAPIPVQSDEAQVSRFSDQYKILVVDDNEVNRMLVEYMLTQWGLSFCSVPGGREAIEMLQKERFHLVLMDIQMPELDGYAAAHIIKTELQLSVRIIAMTAHVLPGEEEKCRAFGMDGYISKPLQEAELNKLLATHLPEGGGAGSPSFEFIDPGFLSHKFYGNQAFIQKILNQVRKQYPEEMQTLMAAWLAKNAPAIASAAHKMASTVSILHQGSGPMALLQEIEHAAKKELPDWEEIDALVKKLDSLTVLLMNETTRMEQLRFYEPSLS